MADPRGAIGVVAVRPVGRRALTVAEEALSGDLVPRADLVGVQGPRPGSGRSDGEFWQGERWFVKSRAGRVFPSAAPALAALDQLYEVKVRLGELAPSGTVLAVTEHDGGHHQLWTIAARLVTLRERLDDARAAERWDDFSRALVGFARGLGEAISASVEHGLGLDPNPGNFAVQGGRLRYIDDDVTATRDALGVEDAFVARFAEYADAPAAVWASYVARFGDELVAHVAADHPLRARFGPRVVAAAVLKPAAAPHVERLLARLEGAR